MQTNGFIDRIELGSKNLKPNAVVANRQVKTGFWVLIAEAGIEK